MTAWPLLSAPRPLGRRSRPHAAGAVRRRSRSRRTCCPTDIARSALSQPQQRDAVDYVLSAQEGRLPASPLRQFRNVKGSIDPLDLAGQMLDDFGQVCAVILARRHTRTLHPSALRGYLKGAKELDEALAAYAQDCADQVERDRADLLAGPGARRVRRPVRVTSRRRHLVKVGPEPLSATDLAGRVRQRMPPTISSARFWASRPRAEFVIMSSSAMACSANCSRYAAMRSGPPIAV